VLEVSLRKAGFMVTAANSVQDALGKLELHAPDLIISETTFPDGDGFELRRRVRATADWSEIPFIFLTAEAAIENKIRGLELGVDDYLTKPIYIKEIVTRINILLQKRQRVRFEERRDNRTRFTGRVQDMPVVDVIQTIEISRKSGVIQFVGERGRQAAIYFRDGRVIDAEAGALQGEDAVYRLLTWSEGEFEVVFRTVRRREVIAMSSQGLLMEGMRRLDEWSRLFEQLPPLTHRFEVDTSELAARLGDVPDDNNRILRLVDGKRTLLEVIDASDVGDLECLQAISRLYFEELLLDLDHGKAPVRDPAKPLAAGDPNAPAAQDDTTSGPLLLDTTEEPNREPQIGDAGTAEPGPTPASPEPSAEPAGPDEPSESAYAGEGAEVDEASARDDGETAAEPSDDDGEAEHEDGYRGEPPSFDGHGSPLLGGYRPSSLRLIDEAVAAAQAIEPSLFDGTGELAVPTEPAEPAARHAPGHRGNGVARHEPAPSEDAERPAQLRTAGHEDSGLRMIGSLGRDRAEASGELAPLGQARPLRSETARELVTILPRRATREMPIVTPEGASALPTPTPTPTVLAPKPVVVIAPAATAVAAPPPRMLPGTGVRALSRSRRLLRIAQSVERSGPGLGAVLLIVLAAILAGTAVYLRLRRHAVPAARIEGIERISPELGSGANQSPGPRAPVVVNAEPTEPPHPGASDRARGASADGSAAGAGRASQGVRAPTGGGNAGASAAPGGNTADGRGLGTDGAGGRGSATGDGVHADGAASLVGSGSDGGNARGPVAASGGGSGGGTGSSGDKVADAKGLYDKAHDAFESNDFERTVSLADASLKLRRTARTYLLRAQAQQRLDRIEDALGSVQVAAQLAPEFGTVWELRGRILWAAQRREEARVAFEKFLALEPNNPKAASVRRLLNEPR
jgi:CheY-like chemotaxis protein